MKTTQLSFQKHDLYQKFNIVLYKKLERLLQKSANKFISF